MANSATRVDSFIAEIGRNVGVNEYEVVIDTINTETFVQTAASATSRIWIVGIWLSETSAINLTFVSSSSATPGAGVASKTQTWELAANQGLTGFTQQGFYFVCKPGESLKVKSDTAIGSTVGKNLVLRVLDGDEFR